VVGGDEYLHGRIITGDDFITFTADLPTDRTRQKMDEDSTASSSTAGTKR